MCSCWESMLFDCPMLGCFSTYQVAGMFAPYRMACMVVVCSNLGCCQYGSTQRNMEALGWFRVNIFTVSCSHFPF